MMKNWLPLLLRPPVFASDTVPRRCGKSLNSSGSW
jgi:hypothetical protein